MKTAREDRKVDDFEGRVLVDMWDARVFHCVKIPRQELSSTREAVCKKKKVVWGLVEKYARAFWDATDVGEERWTQSA